MKRLFFIAMSFLLVIAVTGCKDEYEDTRDAGSAYLSLNASQDGVERLSNGLQYKKYYPDNETWPAPPSLPTYVNVNYTAMFINGDTLSSGNNVTMGYSVMVKGLQVAIRHMRIGSKWRIWVPYNLAYGSDGIDESGLKVDPYTALIYDLELLGAN
ncbi:MAG: FKBP-type peptidyl-prolyl cis-trans isomerase [Paludibacteraceae bacterium]|nr:FKBP-type peptidyl-prolyl cis-trans isomerase [Paludibacteraceae bacterium]